MEYTEFVRSKFKFSKVAGIEVTLDEINPNLKPHTRAIVQWALHGGRRAVFAAFGLHKTATQLEIMRHIGLQKPGTMRLITMPLGVRQEFKREVTERFKDEHHIELKFIRSDAEIDDDRTVYMTNYESVREGKINLGQFNAASLDEASVLRSYGSKTYQEFLPLFNHMEFKFVNTATPSPNRFKELIHYAGFLGIMDTGQALTRFFKRDSSQAGNLQLHPHKEAEFYIWLHSWAIFIQRPSDLGFSDEGYELPDLDVRYHEVPCDYQAAGADRDGQNLLFQDVSMGVQAASAEKRNSMSARIAKAAEIVAQDPDDHFIVWHDLEDERHAIQKAIPNAVSVYGSQDLDEREKRIVEFSDGEFSVLSTKPIIAGSGCNFQRHCHREIFAGIGFKFNDFIQAIYRVQRFQQAHQVRIDIIYSEAEREVLASLKQKWELDKQMRARMSEIIRKHGLSTIGLETELSRSMGIERQEVTGEHFTVVNNDCVDETVRMEENSVGLIVTSIPFSNHYEYTPSYNDFGHTENNDQFWQQMDYLTSHLLRVLMPGRIYCCHVKDRILFGNVTGAGAPTVSPFHAEAIFHGLKHGFDYMGMITVVTDVVRENNQTYRLGWTEQCKDGTKMGVGSPEYVLLFRKPQTDRSRGYADIPVVKSKEDYTRARWQIDAHAFWRSSGDRLLCADELVNYGPDVLAKLFTQRSGEVIYDYWEHVKLGEALEGRNALPSDFMSIAPASNDPDVWHDVNRMLTLNGDQTKRGLNNHICPLQIDIVDRLIIRYSNKGDVVYDPFAGLMTVPYRAVDLGRYGRGAELNSGYFKDGVSYMHMIERKISVPTLFTFENLGEAA